MAGSRRTSHRTSCWSRRFQQWWSAYGRRTAAWTPIRFPLRFPEGRADGSLSQPVWFCDGHTHSGAPVADRFCDADRGADWDSDWDRVDALRAFGEAGAGRRERAADDSEPGAVRVSAAAAVAG